MKVAINGMLLSRCVSGVELSILNLVKGLAAEGTADYRLYTPQRFRESVPADGCVTVVRTRVRAHRRLLRIVWEQVSLPRLVRSTGCDVLHAPAYVIPLRAATPTVLTVYDLMALSHPTWCRHSNRWNYRLWLPPSIRKARSVVVPSDFTAREVAKRFPGAEEKVTVVPLGISQCFFDVTEDERHIDVLRRYGIAPPFILFVSRHEPKKNLATLIRAFHALKVDTGIPHKLVLAGDRGWGCGAAYASIRQLGLQGEVLAPGFIPETDLAVLYAEADLFVFPSLYEGFGLPPLEAMATGTPVVSSHAGALRETVGDDAVRVDPTQPADVARGIRELLDNPDLRTTLGQTGRMRAAEFTWSNAAIRMEEVYREVAGE